MVALCMAVLYLPTTAHCLLEHAGVVVLENCCPASECDREEETVPGPTGCCPIEFAVYFAPQKAVLTSPLVVEFPSTVHSVEIALPEPSILITPTQRPPDLVNSWQFSFRTALPPRAPSLVS